MRIPFGNRMLRRIGTTTVAVLIVRGYDRRLYDRCEVVVGLLVWAVAKGATNSNKPLARWPLFKRFYDFGF
jgi:hypothetical protein